MAESLKNKTVKGVAWNGIDNILSMAVTFVVGIVLARLLTPDDYGLIGIITIFTAVCDTLVVGGFRSALIRKKNVSEDDYNTVFIVNLIVSFVLYVVLFICSPLIAEFFQREELINLTRTASIGVIIGALALVQQTRLTKRIDFKTQTKITFVASTTSGIIGITMAFIGFGVWSIVFQHLSSLFFKTIGLWKVNKWIPNFHFSKDSFKELFGYGWKMMTSQLLDTIWKELYQVVVGKFYSPSTLGQYTRAKQFSKLLSSNLTGVVQKVTFPVLSNIQDNQPRMISAYKKIIKTTMFVTAVSMFFLGAISEPLLYCLIGPKWHDAAVYLPLICITGSTYPLQAINLNMLQVQGRSDLFLGLEIVKKIISIGPLIVGIFIGILPMLYTGFLTTIIAFFLNSHYSGKLLGYSSWMQLKDVAPSYALGLIVAVSVYFFKYLPLTYWIILPLQLMIGCSTLFAICHIKRYEEFEELKNILLSKLKK